jgi:hypothetical protein
MEIRIELEPLRFSVLHSIISSLLPIDIQMDNAVRFASQRENDF